MKNLIFILPVLVLISFCHQLYAQKKDNTNPKINIKFSFPEGQLPERVVISVNRNLNYWDTSEDYDLKLEQGKPVNFELEQDSLPVLFNLIAVISGKPVTYGRFYTEKNDKVNITYFGPLNTDSATFEGVGAAKYRLANELQQPYYYYVMKNRGKVKSPKSFLSVAALEKYMNDITSTARTLLANKRQLIRDFRDVSPQMKQLFDYEYAQYNSVWFSELSYAYQTKCNGNPDFQQQIRTFFNTHFEEMKLNSEIGSLGSPFHLKQVDRMLKLQLIVNSDNSGIDMKTYYESIRDYSFLPAIREKLLCQFFMSSNTMRDVAKYDPLVYDGLLADAQKYVVSARYREIIDRKVLFKNGAALFNVDFIGLDGKQLNTASLKGKVVLIDGWGEGCTGCARFHRMFEKDLAPHLSQNKDFELLSIHTGKSKEGWERGMKSGMYTSKAYLNVSSLPMGMEHPFYTHYHVNYSPFLLLVGKDGKLISRLSGEEKPADILQLIQTALLTKESN